VGNKILLIDDSVTVQKIITLTFSDEGVDVVTVDSGDEAINLLHYLRPALVMADVSIPGKNGYDVCAYIKNTPELKTIPVVLLVPGFETYDAERARRVGADHHLTKPFQSIRSLITTVKSLLDPGQVGRGTAGLGATTPTAEEDLLEIGALVAPPAVRAADSWLELPPATPLHSAPPVESTPLPVVPPFESVATSDSTGPDLSATIAEIAERVSAAVGARLAGEIAGMESRVVAALRAELLDRVAVDISRQITGQLVTRIMEELPPLIEKIGRTGQPGAPSAPPAAGVPPRVAVRPYDDPDQLLELDEF
jgi:CheY-like chemotaxis protein